MKSFREMDPHTYLVKFLSIGGVNTDTIHIPSTNKLKLKQDIR